MGNQLDKADGSMTHIVNITPQLRNYKEAPVSCYSKDVLKGKMLSGGESSQVGLVGPEDPNVA